MNPPVSHAQSMFSCASGRKDGRHDAYIPQRQSIFIGFWAKARCTGPAQGPLKLPEHTPTLHVGNVVRSCCCCTYVYMYIYIYIYIHTYIYIYIYICTHVYNNPIVDVLLMFLLCLMLLCCVVLCCVVLCCVVLCCVVLFLCCVVLSLLLLLLLSLVFVDMLLMWHWLAMLLISA